jgi:hypothetical protein
VAGGHRNREASTQRSLGGGMQNRLPNEPQESYAGALPSAKEVPIIINLTVCRSDTQNQTQVDFGHFQNATQNVRRRSRGSW